MDAKISYRMEYRLDHWWLVRHVVAHDRLIDEKPIAKFESDTDAMDFQRFLFEGGVVGPSEEVLKLVEHSAAPVAINDTSADETRCVDKTQAWHRMDQ